METPNSIREFLTSRRSRLTPELVGLPDYGGRRRVQGLRREEVALLAGMSVEYYTRLERGTATGVSESILDGISRALQLDGAERTHLYDLVRAANNGAHPPHGRQPVRPKRVSRATRQLLDAMTNIPALVQNGRLDVLAVNSMGRVLFPDMFAASETPNFARYLFLDARSESFYRDWHESAEQLVALLRIEAGRFPYDRELSDLIGELNTRSQVFRKLWATHDVREHTTGAKRIHHDAVGDIEVDYQALGISDDPGLQLIAFTAAAGSASATAMQLLGNIAATNPDTRIR